MSYPPWRVRSIMCRKTNYMKLAAASGNHFTVNQCKRCPKLPSDVNWRSSLQDVELLHVMDFELVGGR